MPQPIKNPLQGQLRDYYPDAARARLTPNEARKEYNRLRRIANKRLEALGRNFPESKIYREYAGRFPAAGKESERRIYNRLYEVSKFLLQKMGSVTGQRAYRKRAIASLREAGYDFINESNFDAFTDFMEEVKSHSESRGYDSEQIVELFERTEKENADPEEVAKHFSEYLDNEDIALPKKKAEPRTKQKPKREIDKKLEERRKQYRPGARSSRRGGRRGKDRKPGRRRR